MSAEEQAGYNGRAKAENQARNQFAPESLGDVDKANHGRRKTNLKSFRREWAQRTFIKMQESPIWGSGLGLSSFGYALKPEHVIQDSTSNIHARATKLFKFDHAVYETPKHTLVPFKTCSQSNGGVCRNLDISGALEIGSKNLCAYAMA